MNGVRDQDQLDYEVTSNSESFHKFNEKFSKLLNGFDEEFVLLSCNMMDHFEKSKQPVEEFERKMDLRQQLKHAISKYNPTWIFNIVPTGSTVTGLATKNSDLDLAIHIPQAAKILEGKYAAGDLNMKIRREREMKLHILQIVRAILENDEQIKQRIKLETVKIVQAQIQILKIETTDGIECDISVVMELFLSSMHNSFMIRHFVDIDARFAPLCAIVKEWAASSGVKNPKDGGFNSYALVLLVIHFLQCGTNPPILPNLLQVYKNKNFIAMNDTDFPLLLDFGASRPFPLPMIQRNNSSLAELFLRFLYYYHRFNFKLSYISFREAMIKNRPDSGKAAVQNEINKEVYIEDPFDSHNPGRTVRAIKQIKSILAETINMFVPPQDPTGNLQNQKDNFMFPTLHDILNMKASIAIPISTGAESEEEDVHGDGNPSESDDAGPSTSGIPPVYRG